RAGPVRHGGGGRPGARPRGAGLPAAARCADDRAHHAPTQCAPARVGARDQRRHRLGPAERQRDRGGQLCPVVPYGAISAGIGWALLNASVIVVASFAPSFLMSRCASVTEAGLITGTALWISIVAVPLGGLVADRVNRPRLLIVSACLAATVTIACIAPAPMPA